MWMRCWRITHEADSGVADYNSVAWRFGSTGWTPLLGVAESSGYAERVSDGGRFGVDGCEGGRWKGPFGVAYGWLGSPVWDYVGGGYARGGDVTVERDCGSGGGGVCLWGFG